MARKIINKIHDTVSLNGIKLVDGIPEGCHLAQAMSSPEILNMGKLQILEALNSGTLSQNTKEYYKKIHENMIFYEKNPGEDGLKSKGLNVERLMQERASILEDINVNNMMFDNNREFNQSKGKVLSIPEDKQDELSEFNRDNYLKDQKDNINRILEETKDNIKPSLKR